MGWTLGVVFGVVETNRGAAFGILKASFLYRAVSLALFDACSASIFEFAKATKAARS